jgi:hypothetical protein
VEVTLKRGIIRRVKFQMKNKNVLGSLALVLAIAAILVFDFVVFPNVLAKAPESSGIEVLEVNALPQIPDVESSNGPGVESADGSDADLPLPYEMTEDELAVDSRFDRIEAGSIGDYSWDDYYVLKEEYRGVPDEGALSEEEAIDLAKSGAMEKRASFSEEELVIPNKYPFKIENWQFYGISYSSSIPPQGLLTGLPPTWDVMFLYKEDGGRIGRIDVMIDAFTGQVVHYSENNSTSDWVPADTALFIWNDEQFWAGR